MEAARVDPLASVICIFLLILLLIPLSSLAHYFLLRHGDGGRRGRWPGSASELE